MTHINVLFPKAMNPEFYFGLNWTGQHFCSLVSPTVHLEEPRLSAVGASYMTMACAAREAATHTHSSHTWWEAQAHSDHEGDWRNQAWETESSYIQEKPPSLYRLQKSLNKGKKQRAEGGYMGKVKCQGHSIFTSNRTCPSPGFLTLPEDPGKS